MGELIYSAMTSRDGFVEDERGSFAWAQPDEEVHAAVNDLLRPLGTHIYGRRMYETMLFWERADLAELTPLTREFALLWRDATKIVYSRTLEEPASARTHVERDLDPSDISRLKASTPYGLSVGGAELAGHFISHGLVDECFVFVGSVTVGGGKPAFAPGALEEFALVDERPFASGVVLRRFRQRARGGVASA